MTEQVTTEKLFQDLQIVVRDAEALLKATAGQAGEKLQEARAKTEESLRQAKTRIESLEQAAVNSGKEMVNSAEDYVRQNPWQAIGVAAGVGLVLGVLLSRK
jgi:ElaB/YqjD/DUF883 family membrane-anchored ribosome-binding protein